MKKARWIIAILLLLAAGVIGLTNLPDELREAVGFLQRSVAVGEAIYSVLGIVGGIGLILRKRWSVAVAAAFSAAVVYVGSVASIAWMEPTAPMGEKAPAFAGAAISTALIGWFIIWAARSAVRENLPRPDARDHIPTP